MQLTAQDGWIAIAKREILKVAKFAKTWVFDLDNTLHNASPLIFPHISRSMTEYLKTYLKLDESAANQPRPTEVSRFNCGCNIGSGTVRL